MTLVPLARMAVRALTQNRALLVAVWPVALLIGALSLPTIGDPFGGSADTECCASALHWTWSVGMIVMGLALSVPAAFAVRTRSRKIGEKRWGSLAVALFVFGIGLQLGLMGLYEWSIDPVIPAYPTAAVWLWGIVDLWPVKVGIAARLLVSLGLLSLAVSIVRSKMLGRELSWIVVDAMIVAVVALFINRDWGINLVAAALVVAFWPLAYAMHDEMAESPPAPAPEVAEAPPPPRT